MYMNFHIGMTCDVGTITGLNLAASSLLGTIPDPVSVLTTLNLLDLSLNSMTGTIPTQLGALEQLTALELTGNSFTGTIPSFIGLYSALINLRLSDNKFTGNLPETFIQLNTSIAYVGAANNDLEGELDGSLCVLIDNVTVIDLSGNPGVTCYQTCWELALDGELLEVDEDVTLCSPTFSPTELIRKESFDQIYLIPIIICTSMKCILFVHRYVAPYNDVCRFHAYAYICTCAQTPRNMLKFTCTPADSII